VRGLRILLLAVALAGSAEAARTVSTLRSAAQTGDAQAQFELGEAYRTGRGIAADPDMAILWYRRAAAKGHAQASDELGFLLFAKGERREAIAFIEKAAAHGDARAFYLLGTAHFNGDYVKRDWPLAYAQTSRAVEGGIVAANRNLDQMGRYLLAGDRAKAERILETLPPIRRPAPPAAAPAAPAAAPSPAPPSPPPPPAASPPAVRPWSAQIGSYPSAARARAGWQVLTAKVARLRPLEQRILPGGRMVRLVAAGLASKAEAEALCRDLKRAGGDCRPIAP
jgi:tetratricopeptide (TPR) repeat protein